MVLLTPAHLGTKEKKGTKTSLPFPPHLSRSQLHSLPFDTHSPSSHANLPQWPINHAKPHHSPPSHTLPRTQEDHNNKAHRDGFRPWSSISPPAPLLPPHGCLFLPPSVLS
ncbi:hypothetical protein BHE74_00016634 [Ensete ventricosum]|nr:hypothetical protein BHE74_00016634 [Ensete ventricosum]